MDPRPPAPERAAAAPSPARRTSRRASLIGSAIALAAVLGLGWLAWSLTHREPAAAAAGPGGGPRGAPATTVGVATAERTDLPVILEALGTVVPQATVRVRPQVSGVLQEVRYREGQMVRKGDLLAVIDPRPFEMALQQAVGQRMRDEAQLEAARVTLKRYQTLLEQDSIARQEVDTQAALVKQLEAAVVGDRATEGTARLNLGYARITAPITGRVGLRTVDVGNVVGTSDTNGVAVITQMTPIDVEFAVPQDQVPALQGSGGRPMPVRALDRSRANVLDTGVFASFDNQIDTQTGTVRAKARFTNPQGQLFPNQFVNVQLQLRTIEGATVVPVAAVRNGANGDYVFLLNADRTVSLRPIKRGLMTADKVQVTQGLQPGDQVVTEGADRLRDGARVLLPGDASRAAGAGGGGPAGQRRRPGASAPAP